MSNRRCGVMIEERQVAGAYKPYQIVGLVLEFASAHCFSYHPPRRQPTAQFACWGDAGNHGNQHVNQQHGNNRHDAADCNLSDCRRMAV